MTLRLFDPSPFDELEEWQVPKCAVRRESEREEWEGLAECVACGARFVTYLSGRTLCYVEFVGAGFAYGQVYECRCGAPLSRDTVAEREAAA